MNQSIPKRDKETMMKMLKIATLILMAANSAYAKEVKYVSDGATLSDICITALASRDEARRKALESGLSRFDWSNLRCNGAPLNKFIRAQPGPETPVGNYVMQPGDDSAATELCVAAVTSPGELDELAASYFGRQFDVSTSLRCNGEPIELFMQKYLDNTVATSL